MDRRHGKYTVTTEPSGIQLVCAGPNAQEAHSSTDWCPPPNDITGNVSSNLPGVWRNPTIHTHAGCLHSEPPNPQANENCCSDWSLCKVFLACLLACVLTTAIGVLILSLVKNKATNSSIVIQLLPNGQPTIIASGTTTATAQPAVPVAPGESTTIGASPATTTTAPTTTIPTQLPSTSTSTESPTTATSTATTAATTASTPQQTTTATSTRKPRATRKTTSTGPTTSATTRITKKATTRTST
ncbi:dynactin-associated protein-like [Perognathus longimembris pacificus]|uniref:dynactin-associated protein-like n=1 Tax=Perognathus longimembris pacificus TaxID=214514 RepID=UPI0020197B8A|nr:dynactin-associated protein-like [Perognathus longimembris pacificus]